LQLLGIFQLGAVGNGDIFRQIQQLTTGERLAKILAGDIRKLMSFIEDHHLRFGDQLGETALLHHHIGKEKVVVNHHHIGIHRLFTRFNDEAIFVQRAVAAETVIIGAGHQRPGLRVFGDADAGADIAIYGLIRPGSQQNDVAQGLHRQIAAGQSLLLKTLKAQVFDRPFSSASLPVKFSALPPLAGRDCRADPAALSNRWR
jgi:hypothetical protein